VIVLAILWSRSRDLPVFWLTLLGITCNCDLWKPPRLDKIRYNHTFLSTASSLSSPNMASINHRCMGNANLDVTWVQLFVATSEFWNASLIFKHRNPLFKRLLKVQVTFAFSFQNFTANLILLSSSGEKPRNIFKTTVMEPSRHSKRTCHSPYSQFKSCLPSVYGSITCIGG